MQNIFLKLGFNFIMEVLKYNFEHYLLKNTNILRELINESNKESISLKK